VRDRHSEQNLRVHTHEIPGALLVVRVGISMVAQLATTLVMRILPGLFLRKSLLQTISSLVRSPSSRCYPKECRSLVSPRHMAPRTVNMDKEYPP
jgi:hypothetical protein